MQTKNRDSVSGVGFWDGGGGRVEEEMGKDV